MTYTDETTIDALGFVVPNWIEQDITVGDVIAITEGGCASGAYMPAVTYRSALRTMNEYGDEVLYFIHECGMDASLIVATAGGWAVMACDLLSAAVEAWAFDTAHSLNLDGW
jgi:hypothetical protein